jgi:hypothetical protein
MCISVSANRRLRWQPLAAISGACSTFIQPWQAGLVHADFLDRMQFLDSVLLDNVLSDWERDELMAQRSVYRNLANFGAEVTKSQIVTWLSDALAEHLTSDQSQSRAYSLAQLTLLNELTEAVFNA